MYPADVKKPQLLMLIVSMVVVLVIFLNGRLNVRWTNTPKRSLPLPKSMLHSTPTTVGSSSVGKATSRSSPRPTSLSQSKSTTAGPSSVGKAKSRKPLQNEQIISQPDPMSIDIRSLKGHHLKAGINMSNIDYKTCANAYTSAVKLASNKREFQVGETIKVVVELFDSYKKRKVRGGDFVRVLMREKSKGAIACGNVTDNKDGTYTGYVKALWTGSPQIEATVVGTREAKEIWESMYRELSFSRYFLALFESGDVNETTRCLPVPQVPGYTHVCNLTAENYGFPWYCGKPSHRNLLCHNFEAYSASGTPTSHALTAHEKRFFDKNLFHQKIPGILQIKVTSEKAVVPLPNIPCNKSPTRQSWEASSPIGFFYLMKWYSLTCKNTVPLDANVYRKCLKDRTLWLHGDSTTRHWFQYFKKYLGIPLVSGEWFNKKWHKPSVLFDEKHNIKIFFAPQELPFYRSEMGSPTLNRATHTYLDALPSDSRDIFVIHMFLHFHASSPTVFRSHIRRIVQSVKSLVSRAPNVKIAVRGGHAFRGTLTIGFLDDIWMLPFDRILKEEFREVQDKVLFLNNEDITITTEIDDNHPPPVAMKALIEHLMGSVCD